MLDFSILTKSSATTMVSLNFGLALLVYKLMYPLCKKERCSNAILVMQYNMQ